MKSYGYEKSHLTDKWDRVWGIEYKNIKEWISIRIDFIDATVCIATLDDENEPVYIPAQVLKLVNMKCKEIGMVK